MCVLTADRVVEFCAWYSCLWKVVKFSFHLFNIIAIYSLSFPKDTLRLDCFNINLLQSLPFVNKEVRGSFILNGSLVTTAWHILRFRTQESASWDRQLCVCVSSTGVQPKRDSLSSSGVGGRLTNRILIVAQDATFGWILCVCVCVCVCYQIFSMQETDFIGSWFVVRLQKETRVSHRPEFLWNSQNSALIV